MQAYVWRHGSVRRFELEAKGLAILLGGYRSHFCRNGARLAACANTLEVRNVERHSVSRVQFTAYAVKLADDSSRCEGIPTRAGDEGQL